jgi:hypothetical protein
MRFLWLFIVPLPQSFHVVIHTHSTIWFNASIIDAIKNSSLSKLTVRNKQTTQISM